MNSACVILDFSLFVIIILKIMALNDTSLAADSQTTAEIEGVACMCRGGGGKNFYITITLFVGLFSAFFLGLKLSF